MANNVLRSSTSMDTNHYASCSSLGEVNQKELMQDENANTITRKYFHAMVVFVYTSGTLIDVNFLYLS